MVLYILVHPINARSNVIQKVKMNVSFPGVKWAEEMQATRDATPAFRPDNEQGVMFEGTMVEVGVVFCSRGSIKLSTLSGGILDYGSAAPEFEFVKYDKTRGLIILALNFHDEKEADIFDALFPSKSERSYQDERAFLIIPAKDAKSVTAWVLAPSGKDAHASYGTAAPPKYLERLIGEARA